MYEKAKLMWLYTEQPVHAGAGTGVGVIDLPIQRERMTGWPIIQASGVKGCLREHFKFQLSRQAQKPLVGNGNESGAIEHDASAEVQDDQLVAQDPPEVEELFGSKKAEHAGALTFADAKVLLFPIRSVRGTFAYITCPLAILRLNRELKAIKAAGGPDLLKDVSFFSINADSGPAEDDIWVGMDKKNSNIVSDLTIRVDIQGAEEQSTAHHVGLEELSFNASGRVEVNDLAKWLKENAENLPWIDAVNLSRRLAIVSDNQFKDFVEMSTEVVTRNQIDNTSKTVKQGQLWTEEHLPRETVLYAAVFASDPCVPQETRTRADASDVMDFLTDGDHSPKYLWIGGNVTVGRGLVRVVFS